MWRIKMSDCDAAGAVIASTTRILGVDFPTQARAFAFQDGILEGMGDLFKCAGRRPPKFEIVEVAPQAPAQHRWGPP